MRRNKMNVGDIIHRIIVWAIKVIPGVLILIGLLFFTGLDDPECLGLPWKAVLCGSAFFFPGMVIAALFYRWGIY